MPRLYNQDVAGVVRLKNSLTLSGTSCLVPCTTASTTSQPHACQVNVGIGKQQQQQQRHRYPLSLIPYRATINTMTTYDDEGGGGVGVLVSYSYVCTLLHVPSISRFPRDTTYLSPVVVLSYSLFPVRLSPCHSSSTDRGITRYSGARMCGGGMRVFQIRKKLLAR